MQLPGKSLFEQCFTVNAQPAEGHSGQSNRISLGLGLGLSETNLVPEEELVCRRLP